MPLETPNSTPLVAVAPNPNGFAPLKIPLFRDRWIASTVSSIGTWMQDTAGTWLMTSLTTSPLLIALMQTAASLAVPQANVFPLDDANRALIAVKDEPENGPVVILP
jgi:CBS-domain-containing membrane protein